MAPGESECDTRALGCSTHRCSDFVFTGRGRWFMWASCMIVVEALEGLGRLLPLSATASLMLSTTCGIQLVLNINQTREVT